MTAEPRPVDDDLGFPEPVSVADAVRPDDHDTYLIEGMLRPGHTGMVVGTYGLGKSYLTRQLAYAAAAGHGYFLTERFAIPRPLRVLIVDEDNGEREEWRREEQLMEHLDLRRHQLTGVYRVCLAGVELDKAQWQEWLLELVTRLELDLVILDPISEFHGGKELRDDPSFRALRMFLKRLKTDHPDLATVLVHHTRKMSVSDRSSVRGLDDIRGQWGQTPDAVILLSDLGERRARCELLKRIPHAVLILEQVAGGGWICVADEPVRRSSTDSRVLAAVEAGATSADEVATSTGLAERTVWNAIQRLRKAHLLTARAPLQLTGDEA